MKLALAAVFAAAAACSFAGAADVNCDAFRKIKCGWKRYRGICVWSGTACTDFFCSALPRTKCNGNFHKGKCLWTGKTCEDFSCGILSRQKCGWRKYKSKCLYKDAECVERPPPTRRPTKSPTAFTCSSLNKLRCGWKKYRGECMWTGKACVDFSPTAFPTQRPTSAPTAFDCSNAATLSGCRRTLKYRKNCQWSSSEKTCKPRNFCVKTFKSNCLKIDGCKWTSDVKSVGKFCAQCAEGDDDADCYKWTSYRDSLAYPAAARHHPITFSDGSTFGYVMAGITGTFDMWKINHETKKWTSISSTAKNIPPPREYAYGVAIDKIAYMGFGIASNDERNGLRDWYSYDMDKNEFKKLADLPAQGAARWHPAIVAVEAKRFSSKEWFIVVSCGSSRTDGNLKDTWEYRVKTNTWTKRPDIPGPPRHHPFYFDAKTTSGKHFAYVGFGHAYREDGYVLRDLYRYDVISKKWNEMKLFPGEGRVAGTQFSFHYSSTKSRGYLLSGDGDNHGPMETGELWEYDPNGDSWKELAPHPGNSLWAPGSFVINCDVYLTSGYDRKAKKRLNTGYTFTLPECENN